MRSFLIGTLASVDRASSSVEVLVNYLKAVICLCIAQISKRVNWTEFLSIVQIGAGLFSRRRLLTLFPPPHPPPDPSPRFRKPHWRCRCLPADVGRHRSDKVERGDGKAGSDWRACGA